MSTIGAPVAIGALTRHVDIEHSDVLAREVPLLSTRPRRSVTRRSATVARSAARSRTGTPPPTCPPASWPSTRQWSRGAPRAPGDPGGEFFRVLETALDRTNCSPRSASPKRSTGVVVPEVHPTGHDWAIVGCAMRGGRVTLVNMGGTPLRAAATEAALAGGASPADAAAHAAEGTHAADDIRATKAYREHLARVLVSRALTEASSRS